MSAHMSLPHIVNLYQVIHMFGYLKIHPKRRIEFESAHPSIDERRFKNNDWYDFYRGVKGAIPLECTEPLGNSISTHCFVDANLAGNLIPRRIQTGVLIFWNRALIIWHRKRHNSVETSAFGNEMMALKNGVKLVKALRYKLRMFGDPIEGATKI